MRIKLIAVLAALVSARLLCHTVPMISEVLVIWPIILLLVMQRDRPDLSIVGKPIIIWVR